MSAYSFVSHRMFVAALSNDTPTTPRPTGQRSAGPVRAAVKQTAETILRPRGAGAPVAGVLLANALLHGYQPAAS